mmetsp:Transcript_73200/g.89838  ORF Transcript_73200/g.89838 Transcript_73200/m.89838 type:complete len:133 (-) Transcript_73200:26-424(-)
MNEPKRQENLYIDGDSKLVESIPYDMIRILNFLQKNNKQINKYYNKMMSNKENFLKIINGNINTNNSLKYLKNIRNNEYECTSIFNENINCLDSYINVLNHHLLRLKQDLNDIKSELQPNCISMSNPALDYQ